MSQHDLDIANQTASAARADLNLALKALGSVNSGASAPATTFANMLWYDTTNNALKMRAEADDAWISVGYLDQSADAFRIFDDTQVVSSSGSQTGLIGDQASSAWQTGTSTTESLVSPAKIASAISSLGSSTTAGAVGTYASLWLNVAANSGAGDTAAGSSLRYGNFGTLGQNYNKFGKSGNAPSGTWRLMGQLSSTNGSNFDYTDQFFSGAVWVRIS